MSMRWRLRLARRSLAAGLVALAGTTAAQAGDFGPATVPERLGASVHRIMAAQVERAEVDQFVFYELEWVGNTASLGPAGRFHLDKVIKRLPDTNHPVIIQFHPDDAVNLARKKVV